MKELEKNCVLERFKELNATPEYQAKNDIASHAISELSNIDKISIVTKEQCLAWLSRYKFFYKNFKGRGPLFFPTLWEFYILYNDVNMFMSCLRLNNQILTALTSFKEVSLEEENSLLEWLLTHEALHNDIPYFEKPENNDHIYISKKLNILVSSVDYSYAIDFQNIFSESYNKTYLKL